MNCRHSLLAIIATIMLASCSQRQEATQFDADSTGIDTTVLRVAVMPAINCLPVFYAERTGLADSLGLEMELLRYQAQMDIDTAITFGHADIAYTDLIRIAKLNKAKVTLSAFASCDEPISLISLKTKRVKQVNQMKEQMIAVSRLSATDYWCDRLLDSTRTSYDDIYRPQVNDVRLRAEMLRQGLIDAAMMGEPYATWMTMLGHKRLFLSKGKQPQLYAWANISATKKQQKVFLDILKEATEQLGKPSEAALLRDILKQEYQLPPALVDSIELQPVRQTSAVRPADTEEAEKWLSKRTRKKP
ncbi:MAG: ABC transporter substrate-binding protein [Bacteroidaceae bacterium]|nr:ABC transporter substrate-binding protein [Bacteroidaceae bacterium]MBQ6226181.1 ABC transporter substrate-binding protein [Bacteroidaceae bacterium]